MQPLSPGLAGQSPLPAAVACQVLHVARGNHLPAPSLGWVGLGVKGKRGSKAKFCKRRWQQQRHPPASPEGQLLTWSSWEGPAKEDLLGKPSAW